MQAARNLEGPHHEKQSEPSCRHGLLINPKSYSVALKAAQLTADKFKGRDASYQDIYADLASNLEAIPVSVSMYMQGIASDIRLGLDQAAQPPHSSPLLDDFRGCFPEIDALLKAHEEAEHARREAMPSEALAKYIVDYKGSHIDYEYGECEITFRWQTSLEALEKSPDPFNAVKRSWDGKIVGNYLLGKKETINLTYLDPSHFAGGRIAFTPDVYRQYRFYVLNSDNPQEWKLVEAPPTILPMPTMGDVSLSLGTEAMRREKLDEMIQDWASENRAKQDSYQNYLQSLAITTRGFLLEDGTPGKWMYSNLNIPYPLIKVADDAFDPRDQQMTRAQPELALILKGRSAMLINLTTTRLLLIKLQLTRLKRIKLLLIRVRLTRLKRIEPPLKATLSPRYSIIVHLVTTTASI